MAARVESVARYICEKAGWSLSNLELNKMLYLVQVFHMGREDGSPLFDASFEAWDYGPVIPDIYHSAKRFGPSAIKDVFYSALSFKENDSRKKVMDDVCEKFLKYSAADLVDITHWDNGAWAKHYVPRKRNIRIPNSDIWQEYIDRQEQAKKRKRSSSIRTKPAREKA